jgi:hypothetical protein
MMSQYPLRFGHQSGVSSSLGFLVRLARTEGRFKESALLAQQACAVSPEQGRRSRGGLSHIFCGSALERLGEYLLHARRIAVDSGAVPPILWALPASALMLADGGEDECAVKLYAVASRPALVAKSPWFSDLAANTVAEVAATLPTKRVVILEERGQAREMKLTVEEFLAELDH